MPSANQKTKSTLSADKLNRLRASNYAGREVTTEELDNILQLVVAATVEKAQNQVADAPTQEVTDTFIDSVQSGLEVVGNNATLARSAAFEQDGETDSILTNILGEIKSLGGRIASVFRGDGGTRTSDNVAGAIRAAPQAEQRNAPRGEFLQGSMASKSGQIGIGILGGLTGAIGGDKVAEKLIQRIVDKEAYIQHETKQRTKADPAFRQLPVKEQRKTLATGFKHATAKRKQLAALDQQAEQMRRQGHSGADIERELQYTATKERIRADIASTQSSAPAIDAVVKPAAPKLLSSATSSTKEEQDQEDKLRSDKELAEQAAQTSLLNEIADILRNKKFGGDGSAGAGDSGSLSLPDFGIPRPTPGGRPPQPPRPAGSSWWSRTRTAAGNAGSKALSFGKGLLSRGAAPLAVAGGLYEGYSEYGTASDKKAASIAEIDRAEQTGEITKREADIKRAEVESQATEDKSGAVGKGAGVAAGALLGAKAGATAGALAGSFIPVVGTAAGGLIGGLVGGAGGAIAGSSVGQNIGGALGRGYENTKSALGFGEPTVNPQVAGVVGTEPNYQIVNKSSTVDVDRSVAGNTTFDHSTTDATSRTFNTQSVASIVNSKDIAQTPRHNAEALRNDSLVAQTAKVPNIVVQAPAPVVIPSPPQTQVVPPPFFNNIRNNEASLSDYLRSRYA